MQLVSCHNGQLQTLSLAAWGAGKGKSFVTGLDTIDALLPGRSFARGAIHEILSEPSECFPMLFALTLARAANDKGAIVWCDPRGELYPPAVAAAGISLDRLFLLHPKNVADETWAVAECMRCKGVSATVAAPPRLGRIEARRLQLAAERGGGVGILLRPVRGSSVYAAATRWLVSPAPGERTVQRWKIQLIHGHGGRVGETVILEQCRETNRLRAVEKLADRPAAKTTSRASA